MELIEALNVIIATCRSVTGTCAKCPLRSCDDGCYVCENFPETWSFKADDVPPRVFE